MSSPLCRRPNAPVVADARHDDSCGNVAHLSAAPVPATEVVLGDEGAATRGGVLEACYLNVPGAGQSPPRWKVRVLSATQSNGEHVPMFARVWWTSRGMVEMLEKGRFRFWFPTYVGTKREAESQGATWARQGAQERRS